jgi:hypothetical protein
VNQTTPHSLDDYFDDILVNLPYEKWTKWEATVDKEEYRRKTYGNTSFMMKEYERHMAVAAEDEELPEVVEPSDLEYEEGKDYRKWELEQIADNLLRADSRRELCRTCDEYGEETGNVESQPQEHPDGGPLVDETGAQLYVDFPELLCRNGHVWYKGEGKARGNGGDNPVLFEEHLKNRQRREIYTSVGTPDPSIVAGIFNRTHPQGRKVNSKEQRSRHGASFYR